MAAAWQIRAGNGIVVKSSNQIDVSLGGRLRDRRTSSGWSQEQLAEKLQIDAEDIYAYEKGAKRITADRLLRLSKVLGVKPVYFFGFDDKDRQTNRDRLPFNSARSGTASASCVYWRQKPRAARGDRFAGDRIGERRYAYVAQL